MNQLTKLEIVALEVLKHPAWRNNPPTPSSVAHAFFIAREFINCSRRVQSQIDLQTRQSQFFECTVTFRGVYVQRIYYDDLALKARIGQRVFAQKIGQKVLVYSSIDRHPSALICVAQENTIDPDDIDSLLTLFEDRN